MEAHRPVSQSTARTLIASVMEDRAEPDAVNRLVDACRLMALTYLRQKVRRGVLNPDLFGLSLDDLALDCVAELFARDGQGRYTQLAPYFEQVAWHERDEEDLQIALRRIVFSKVNEGLFRRYREVDPVLAKIIRSLKSGVRTMRGLRLVRYRGERWIVSVLEDGNDRSRERGRLSQPIVPMEVLEAYLVPVLRGSGGVWEALRAFEALASAQPHYSNGYPMAGFARVVRAALQHFASNREDHGEYVLDGKGEVERVIVQSVAHLRKEMHGRYVGRGKVRAAEYEAYLKAVEAILQGQYGLAAEQTFLEALAGQMPGLEEEVYRQRHRNRLEYLVKLARARLVDYLRD